MPARRRKPKEPNPGRLQLERERFHLPPDYRPPPPDNSKSLSDLLPDAMGSMGLKSDWNVQDFSSKWTNLVGAANAAHCRPGHWERGVLTVYVDHNVWLAELQQFGKVAILKRLQRDFGPKSVRDVRFQLDPGDSPPS